jgi:hypothetical protein
VPRTRTLFFALVVGAAIFVLFAFTIVGLIGEALVVLSVPALLLRAAAVGVRQTRHG